MLASKWLVAPALLCLIGCGEPGTLRVSGGESTIGAVVYVDGAPVDTMRVWRVRGDRPEDPPENGMCDLLGVPFGERELMFVSVRGETLTCRFEYPAHDAVYVDFRRKAAVSRSD